MLIFKITLEVEASDEDAADQFTTQLQGLGLNVKVESVEHIA